MKSTSIVNSWQEIKPRSESDVWPSPRSGHACVVFKSHFLFLFGGMDNRDALNDMYQYNFLSSVPSLFKNSSLRSGPSSSQRLISFLQVP